MSFTADLLVGVAEELEAAQIGLIWQPDGAYVIDHDYGYGPYGSGAFGGGTPLFVMHVPITPDAAVTLSAYGLGDDAVYADSGVGLQVRCRAAGEDPTAVMALNDTAADALLGRFPFTLPTGIRVTTLVRTSDVSLGQDDNRRWSWSSNYSLGLHRPAPHRL